MQLGTGGSSRPRIPRPIVVAAVAWSLLVPTSRAQEAPNLGRRLSLVVGPLFVSQRDEHASPLRYGGAAPFVQIGYATRTSRRDLELRVGSAIGTLRSALTQADNLPRQRTWRAWAEFDYTHRLGSPDARTHWLLGGRITARGTAIQHLYAQSGGTDAGYAFLSAAFSPLIGVVRATSARTTMRARLGVGVLALIGRPYSFFGIGGVFPDHLPARVVTVNAFQAADFTASFAAEVGHRADLVLGYQLVVERYADTQPFRFASIEASLALAWRLGGDQ